MRYVIYCNNEDEYIVDAEKVEINDGLVYFYASNYTDSKIVGVFRLDLIIGFCAETEGDD